MGPLKNPIPPPHFRGQCLRGLFEHLNFWSTNGNSPRFTLSIQVGTHDSGTLGGIRFFVGDNDVGSLLST